MRKLKLQVQISVDGYIAGTNGEMDWLCFDWSQDIMNYVKEITDSADTIVLGRKLAEGFIPHWEAVAQSPENPEYEAGIKFSTTPKVVFTKTLQDSNWARTLLAKGDLVSEITQLKAQNGGDIIAYGGGTFVTSLIKAGLIDEFHLFVNPTAIGKGMTIFSGIDKNLTLQLVEAKQFDCGIALLCYKFN